ncbi:MULTISPECIES: hypothetical protein [Sphingosinicellaceae]|uniref:hypothetical protein n=1 Tax=Sphingosinicellaceae TaxID=2820280 RepID=UPI001C1E2465|nr:MULTISPECIES: hypothetical protein [Polymorphobacter]QYE36033.1 hypothetical protein KZX46_08895 [Polymorphobacter sp. PAMC 29334]UAJ10394.1 hypothetical protein KTC28_01100 [Polymorphobacter megasporae]
MDLDFLWVFIPLAVLAIPVIALLTKPLMSWIALQERKHELAAKIADTTAADHAAKIERLEAHVAVLNRIATDRATGLAHEIEALRAPSPLN